MNVLLLGATGFLGRHIAEVLHAQGHRIHRPQAPNGARLNLTQATTEAAWRPHLLGVDAVINAVGVLRERPGQPMAVVHTAAPVALFRACAEVGIRRVIQVSALGIEVGNTPYARSKRQADVALLACAQAGGLDAVVLRPSIVIGPGGASTALFQTLARWPVLVWPQRARVCRVQALTVADLAWGCARLLGPQAKVTGVVAAVGPEPYSLEAWVARFRMAHGHHAPARVWGMPDGLAGALAGVGDLLPFTPWGSNTWALLAQDNVADVGPWAAVLGRAPMPVLPANMTAPRTHT